MLADKTYSDICFPLCSSVQFITFFILNPKVQVFLSLIFSRRYSTALSIFSRRKRGGEPSFGTGMPCFQTWDVSMLCFCLALKPRLASCVFDKCEGESGELVTFSSCMSYALVVQSVLIALQHLRICEALLAPSLLSSGVVSLFAMVVELKWIFLRQPEIKSLKLHKHLHKYIENDCSTKQTPKLVFLCLLCSPSLSPWLT